MNISRFFGSTNRETLRQVRLALGPEALIVSSRRVNGGVEIMAADPTSVPPAQEAGSKPGVSSSQADLMQEIGAMRGALESRIDDLLWGNQLRQSSHAVTLFQSLLGCGFSTALLRAMLGKLPPRLSARAAKEWVRNELTQNLPVLAEEDNLWQPGLSLALVGPTGVGKTTTIAKLAARAVRRHGPDGVALLTTDTYRIGAYEQLKIYGELLHVPVRVIRDAQELATVLQAIPAHVTVLIDNVGVSQRDRHVSEQAAMLSASSRDIKRLLVLNASSHGSTLDEVARSYAKDGASLSGCIITKADEAGSLGAALDTAIRYRLPIHYISNGQKVPENLLFVRAGALVDRALDSGSGTKALYSPSEADFAALMSVADHTDRHAGSDSAGVERLLGALLSGACGEQSAFQPHAFQATCNAIESILPVAEAWDIWSALSAHGNDQGDIAPHINRMMRTVRQTEEVRDGRPVLAVHGDAPLRGTDNQKGTLRASLLFDAQGNALVGAALALALPEGWWSSFGPRAPHAPATAQMLSMQIGAVAYSRPAAVIVHIFERGSRALLGELNSAGNNWISRIGAVTRVIHKGSLATVSAVAKTLVHQPMVNSPGPAIGDTSATSICSGPDGSALVGVVLWVAITPVEATAGDASLSGLHLVSVKVARRSDGRELRHLFGLAHMADQRPDANELARWLLTAYDARTVFRCASRMWAESGGQGLNTPDMSLKALLAIQTALAARQLLDKPSSVRTMVERLAGAQRQPLSAKAVALHKLFALKAWEEEASQKT